MKMEFGGLNFQLAYQIVNLSQQTQKYRRSYYYNMQASTMSVVFTLKEAILTECFARQCRRHQLKILQETVQIKDILAVKQNL